jgi:hypothetical protein
VDNKILWLEAHRNLTLFLLGAIVNYLLIQHLQRLCGTQLPWIRRSYCVHSFVIKLIENKSQAGCPWFMPVIIATQEDCGSKSAQGKQCERLYLENTHHKKKKTGRMAQAVRVPA